MKHIIIVTTSFPDSNFQPGKDMAGAFAADFAEELGNHAKVTVAAPSGTETVETIGRVTIKRFAVPSLPLSLLNPINPAHWMKILRTLNSGRSALFELAQKDSPDHIFALWALPSGHWARAVKRQFGIPYSIWSLGSDIWSLSKIPIVRNILSNVLAEATARFADGYVLKDDVEKLCGQKCFFLPTSRKLKIEREKVQSVNPPYRLAFLGRWHPNKGIDILLESLHMLSSDDWSKISELRICGGGPLEQTIKDQCSSLKDANRPVSVLGYLNREEATELFLWADYLILPSRIESIPVIFSDAMQGRCPIIATPVGDLPRLMKEYNVGLIAEDTTSKHLYDSIKQALETSPANYGGGLENALEQFDVSNAAQFFKRQIELGRL